MRIAVHLNPSKHNLSEPANEFMVQLIFSLARQQPYHHFILLLLRPYTFSISFPLNVEVVIVTSRIERFFFFTRWTVFKMAKCLRKNKIDVCINYNASSFLSKVPQLLIITDPQRVMLIKKSANSSFSVAKVICTVSEFLKYQIIAHYKMPEDKLLNIGYFAEPFFTPANPNNKEIIKEAYADGYEYFLFPVTAETQHHFLAVLKAFSLFKKWQKTHMKLLVIETSSGRHYEGTDKLNTYKYRDDVRMLSYIRNEEVQKVFAAAYALLFPCAVEVFPVHILQAMQCEVPVITSEMRSITEVGDQALLYANTSSPQEMAEQMKRIFKDEQLRSNLVAEGKQKSERYTLEKTTHLLWQAIQQAVSK